MPLTMNVNNNSTCSTDLVRIIKFEKEKINQIYFKRKSILATVAYQYLDKMRQDRNLTFDWKISFSTTIKKATIVTKHLISYFKSIPNKKSTIINSEDMIHSNFIDSKKQLIDFISLLGFNTSTQTFKDIVHNREQLYQSYAPNNYFNINPIKRGFTIQSILDKVRNRYAHNDKCQIIVFICITNCYDDLPIIRETVPPGTCFVALLDTKTMSAFKQNSLTGVDPMNMQNQWDLIDLGSSDSLFRVAAKLTETVKMLGHRMFPMAKWFVWLNGKAFIINIKQILLLATTSIIGLHHHDYNRTSESEVNLTIIRVILREIDNAVQLNNTLQEIDLQQAEYKRDGFYSRSNTIRLPMFDIAIFIYRNNHPCSFRYLCGWHNEINYFSYRGQLSVYYSAQRLNLSDYLGFIPRQFYHTLGHRITC
ncbi:unnamed protein product [Rotaria sp. Silwood2]|nr:unnamed protein product [Rotaria sp. Silwood2]CAF3969787.1 unnamed protein product [Rotaria sp. Silwood2]